jgi:hypothetical protein
MPLYFFHVRGGHWPTEADEGWALDGILDLSARIDVEDSEGRPVVTVPFASVVMVP